mgnify:CR=1 FL=1
MPLPEDYLKTLKERKKQSKVYVQFQDVGLTLAEILSDQKHKALYIKLAKEHDKDKLLRIAKQVAEKKDIKNKGAYFMRVWQGEK